MTKQLRVLELIENVQHGVTIFDEKLEYVACNDKARTLLKIPDSLCQPGVHIKSLLRLHAERGDYGPGDPEELVLRHLQDLTSKSVHTYIRRNADGKSIRIHGNFTDDGWLISTYSDITREQETGLHLQKLNEALDSKNRKQAQQIEEARTELQRHNEILETIIDNVESGIFMINRDLVIEAANARACILLDLPERLAQPGTKMIDIFRFHAARGEYGPGDPEAQAQERLEQAKSQTYTNFEHTRPNGDVLKIVRVPTNTGFVSTFTDITRLKNTQKELEKASHALTQTIEEQVAELTERQKVATRLTEAIDTIQESVALFDKDDRFVFCNKRFQKKNWRLADLLVPGITYEELIRRAVSRNIFPDAKGREEEFVRRRLEHRKAPDGPLEIRKHGEHEWLLVHEQRLGDGSTISLSTDITGLKRAELAHQESEERFRDFAENGADWFWETDDELRFNFIMGSVEEVAGLTPDQLMGRTREEIYEDMEPVEPAQWQAHKDLLENHHPFTDFLFRWVRPDKEVRYVSLNGKPIFHADGRFKGYRGVGRDVTGLRRAEEALRRSRKMEAIGQLTGGIAHDFNNILGIIQGNLELLEETLQGDPVALHRIRNALRGTERGTDITRKLLGFSRQDAQEIRIASVNELILNLLDLISKPLTAAIEVATHLSSDLWAVSIDTGDLQDALLNLSLNARDAMPSGGSLVIETKNQVFDEEFTRQHPGFTEGEYVTISVSDTGTGMTEDVRERVFEPFFSTKETGQGTGLGLSMVYGFVQRSGGHIQIYSEPAKGTTFHIHLPRVTAEETIHHQAAPFPQRMPVGSEKILVVDDEKGLLDFAVTFLGSLGYEVHAANSADEALTILSDDNSIDLLFSDIIMPGDTDGYQLARQAREKHPDLRILLTSGFTRNREKKLAGGDGFLSEVTANMLNKPYSRVELATHIRTALDTDR
ncbi:PAS-domain containing protein [Sneathiella chinensis]|uniref:histidine kinase n=1 Tax=Sneathiella chinensis TaxID=349750 RepID=A0ABQ5U4T8_9PROT|nr:PAS-domain containing protein [Sneathiella chinensis]GLQ07117.1 hypothetical protein GCM10007924_23380 [Sneathiella chinensis]